MTQIASTTTTKLLQCTNSLIHKPEDACGDGISFTFFSYKTKVKAKGKLLKTYWLMTQCHNTHNTAL